MDEPTPLLRLGEAADQLGWGIGKMRQAVRVGWVKVDSHLLPLRSVRAGGDEHRAAERKVRADDVAAVRAAIDAAIK